MCMTILITGASRGIGAELAIQLAREPHRLLLVARNEKNLTAVCEKCNTIAGKKTAIPLIRDLNGILNDPSEFERMIGDHTDTLDVLVNNAGMIIKKPFEELKREETRQIFDTNYFVPEQLINICLPMLKASASASIINVTTMGAVQGSKKFHGMSAYSASKGALATLTECLAEEFKPLGIRVNALAFGAVQTEMFAEAFPGYTASTNPEEMGRFFKWFVLEGWKRFNGKMLQVTESTP